MRDSDLCPLSKIPRNAPSTYFDMHALTDYRFRAGRTLGEIANLQCVNALFQPA